MKYMSETMATTSVKCKWYVCDSTHGSNKWRRN